MKFNQFSHAVLGFVAIATAMAMLVAAPAIYAGSVEAKQNGVPVTAAPDKAAAVVQTLKAGEVVETVERKGMYWQVKAAGGKTGFVSVMAVKVKASDSDSGSLAGAIQNAVQTGRSSSEGASARARATVMGVRGLDETNDTSYAANTRPNLKAVFSMEEIGRAHV